MFSRSRCPICGAKLKRSFIAKLSLAQSAVCESCGNGLVYRSLELPRWAAAPVFLLLGYVLIRIAAASAEEVAAYAPLLRAALLVLVVYLLLPKYRLLAESGKKQAERDR